MPESAKAEASKIRHYLERNDILSRENLRRNIRASVETPLAWVERTGAITQAAQDVIREVGMFLDQSTGPLGIPDTGPGAEAQRQRAIQAATRFEEAIGEAKPSGRAIALRIP